MVKIFKKDTLEKKQKIKFGQFMEHLYKTQLLKNLQDYLEHTEWQLIPNFQEDEILLVTHQTGILQTFFRQLPEILSNLPEISQEAERTLISCYHPETCYLESLLINPENQDTYHHALLGKLPQRQIGSHILSQLKQLKAITVEIKKNDVVIL